KTFVPLSLSSLLPYKERVFFFGMGGAAARRAAQVLDGRQHGLEAVEKREALAGGSEDRRNAGHHLLGAAAEIREHPVGPLHLQRRKARGLGGLGADRLPVGHHRAPALLESTGHLTNAP